MEPGPQLRVQEPQAAGSVERSRQRPPQFTIVPVSEVLARQGVAIPGCVRYLALRPHLHDTDGFFAAVLQRAA